MKQRDAKVESSLLKAFEAAERFSASRMPNESVSEIDITDLKSKCATIRSILNECDDDRLISCVNSVLSDFGFPDIEHETASRGLIIAKLQGLELVTRLQEVKTAARAAGFADPEVANIDLKNSISADFLKDVTKSLNELKLATQQLDEKLRNNKQSGVALGVGVISVDAGVLVHLIKITTADAHDYLAGKSRVSAGVLKSKLERISQSSATLMNALAVETKKFGRKVVELSARVAKAAYKTYMIALNFIKSTFETNNSVADIKPFDRDVDKTEANDTTSASSRPDISGVYFGSAKGIIYRHLDFIFTSRKVPSSYIRENSLESCDIFNSYGSDFLSFRFSAESRGETEDSPANKSVSATAHLSRVEFLIIKKLVDEERLFCAKEAYYERWSDSERKDKYIT